MLVAAPSCQSVLGAYLFRPESFAAGSGLPGAGPVPGP